ncbi:hypothetical protein [Comamonas antarctica]|uniref:Uncharacterized protein n=1 Tax=Comamonas antarctica TaxID=2743470 RepID=A0A6N1X5E4_9BURK|nr:hypothetical protein [Comamonas antarctica]QKV54664.1 hypothetical protein HUK68_18180 [Comamonas antarctica]
MSAHFDFIRRTPPDLWPPAMGSDVYEGPAFVPEACQAGLREQAIAYALSRHVPGMARGFVVSLNHGEWHVSGELASRIAALVREALLDELARND